MSQNVPLRFGVLCNSYNFQRWQAEIIRDLLADGHQLELLIMNASTWKSSKNKKERIELPSNQLLYRVLYRFLYKPRWRKPVDMKAELKHIAAQACEIRKEGHREYFLSEDVTFIRNQELDFILRFGFNIIHGEILEAAKYGIWSFHHGDEQHYRGGPPGFWEIYESARLTGSVLQRLTPQLDSGVILKKGWFGTVKHSYSEQLDRIIGGSIPFVRQVCHDIITDNADYLNAPSSNTKAKIYRIPGNLKLLIFIQKIIRNRIVFQVKDLFMTEQWNIGVIDASPEKVAFNWKRYHGRVRWLSLPEANFFRADPFFFRAEGVPKIICERFNYRTTRGALELITLDGENQFKASDLALHGEKHFSFPFTFTNAGQIYCIPETSSNGRTDLYKFNQSNGQLEWQFTLIDKPLVDPTLVFFQNLWWLLATLPGNTSGALYVWFSSTLDGPFIAHPANPVKTDVRSSRPAGHFMILDGYLFRPAQNSSRTYGGSIVINQVISMTPNEYIEQQVIELKPDDDWIFSSGLHTISGDEKITLIDAKRYKFIPAATINKLKKKFTIIRK